MAELRKDCLAFMERLGREFGNTVASRAGPMDFVLLAEPADAPRGVDDEEITRTMVDSIRALVPQLRFEPLEDAGHGIVFQKADAVSRLLVDFLR